MLETICKILEDLSIEVVSTCKNVLQLCSPKDRCTETLEDLSIEKMLNGLSNEGIDGLLVVEDVFIETVLDVVGDVFIETVVGDAFIEIVFGILEELVVRGMSMEATCKNMFTEVTCKGLEGLFTF